MGSAVSSIRTRQRFYTYGREYFHYSVLPKSRGLIDAIEISHTDAAKIFSSFVAMDTDGSGRISVSEFHRHFGWKRGVFTERIFDTYTSSEQDAGLTYDEFLVCVWCYASYDSKMMAQYVFNIFDIDDMKLLSLVECDAMLRMVYYNQQDDAHVPAISALRKSCDGSIITLESFIELVEFDNSIIQPAFDIQSRIIEKTTGDGNWEIYRERRREKFGSSEIPAITCDGKNIARFESVDENCELSDDFLSALFQRIERHINAPDGFDSRLEEERYVDKLRDELDTVEAKLLTEEFSIDRVEERKALRKTLWSLVEEIRDAHLDALDAEREQDLGIWDRSALLDDAAKSSQNGNQPLEYSSEDEIHAVFDRLVSSFNESWNTFVDSYTDRFGPATTHWEKLYDPDQNLSFYFQWQTGERCYEQQVGNQPPAICEVCDNHIDLADYKCFNCDAPRSERNKKKYRGRVSLESIMDVE